MRGGILMSTVGGMEMGGQVVSVIASWGVAS